MDATYEAELEEALVELFRYVPEKEWKRALPRELLAAKLLAEKVIEKRRNTIVRPNGEIEIEGKPVNVADLIDPARPSLGRRVEIIRRIPVPDLLLCECRRLMSHHHGPCNDNEVVTIAARKRAMWNRLWNEEYVVKFSPKTELTGEPHATHSACPT
jgi:hypothetical protein